MKTIFQVLAFVALVPLLPAWAAPPELQSLELKPGRAIAYQYRAATGKNPTFLLLPGVNRGPLFEDLSVEKLIATGAGVIAFHFSVHPLSLAQLPERTRADLKNVTLETLAAEAVTLAKHIAGQGGPRVSEIIPVSLSYSGAISPLLTQFPLVIDMVPLTSFTAFSPQLAAYYSSLKAGEIFNPIFGPGITRASLDAAYRSQWYPQVDSVIKQFALPSSRSEEMVEGYTTLSRAVEGFSWLKQKPSKKVRRVFVLAEREAQTLLNDQVRTAEELDKDGYLVSTIVIEGSGHIIPAEKPDEYVEVLLSLANGR